MVIVKTPHVSDATGHKKETNTDNLDDAANTPGIAEGAKESDVGNSKDNTES